MSPAAPGRVDPGVQVATYRRAAARAGGCPARTPTLEALGLTWRLRADALALAAAWAAAAPETAASAAHLRALARAWAAGAARLAPGHLRGPRWRAWFDGYLARSSALPGEGAAWAAMRAEFAVWRLSGVLGDAPGSGA